MISDSSLSPSSSVPVSLQRQGWELLALSATVLFLELALIRWGGAQVRVLAYFPNLLLIGAFLGLGIGCLRASRGALEGWWMPIVLFLAVLHWGLGRIVFRQSSTEEHLWLLYHDLPKTAPVLNNVWLPVVICFAVTVVAFVPPGQMIALRLRTFQAAGRGLAGYAWDLGGSFLGTLLFAGFSFLRTPPLAWFLAVILLGVALHWKSWRRLAVHVMSGALLLAVVHRAERAQTYSPYYGLSVERSAANGPRHVLANGSLHQVMIDTRPDGAAAEVATGYHYPYTLSGHKPRRALVLGAGTGNDVATLLQEGAESVDAVEIDPVIIELGRHDHPNRPYDSPRVRVINTDARAFLNDSRERYDTIIFGTLDSMTRLSALSNVRLDNFVYTTDCLAAARRHLTEDGALILYFMTQSDQIDANIWGMVFKNFDYPPVVHYQHYALFNTIYMAGPAFTSVKRTSRDLTRHLAASKPIDALALPNDDWPFLYLGGRSIGSFYRVVMAWILGLAVVGILIASPELRRDLRQGRRIDVPMFLFGLAFLLLETRAVTAMSLVWGATWLTSAVVFGAILLLVLAGTLAFARVALSLRASVIGLSVSLVTLYFLPNHWLLTMNVPARFVLSLLVVGGPVFFAAMAFARVYSTRRDVGHAFGWNLLGAVAGGLLEFSSMILGLRALLLIALVAYLLAYLQEQRKPASIST